MGYSCVPRFFLVLLVILFASHCTTKTIHGVASTRNGLWHIDRFCFIGDGALTYSVNVSEPGNVYLYTEKDWASISLLPGCEEKFKLAAYYFSLTGKSGRFNLSPPLRSTSYMNVALGNPSDCGSPEAQKSYTAYTIELLNPDSHGDANNHFSADEFGIFTVYKILVVVYLIAACTYGHSIYQTISKGGPMHTAIKMLSIAQIFQGVAAFLYLIHFFVYSKDGEGAPFLAFISKVLEGVCHFQILVMMTSLVIGWALSSSALYDPSEEKKVANVVTGACIAQTVLTIGDFLPLVIFIRFAVCGIMGHSVRKIVAKERSALRRDFYHKLTRHCYIWWLSLPFGVIFSIMFAEYMKRRVILFVTTIGQTVATVLMYKLFLSRSLYWEVSSLSATTLPLRLDKSFGMKKYTS